MFPEETKTGSKGLSIFIATLAFLLISGVFSWNYLNNKATIEAETTEPTTTTTEPANDTDAATESTIKTAPTDLADEINQLEKELTVIEQDQQSDDDTINL